MVNFASIQTIEHEFLTILLTPETPKTPDFKVSTVYYQVENGHDRDGLGNDENYFWKTAKERK